MISIASPTMFSLGLAASNGWQALQIWAKEIPSHPASELRGYAMIARHLEELVTQTGDRHLIANQLHQKSPQQLSELLLNFEGTTTAESLGSLISDRLARRLNSETIRLQKITTGTDDYEKLLYNRYRPSVVQTLTAALQQTVAGRDNAERDFQAGLTASLVANDALPCVARFLSLLEASPHLSSQDFETLKQETSNDMSPAVLPELRDHVRHAFTVYLNLLGL